MKITKKIIGQILSRRRKRVHKHQLGHALIVAGSRAMSGALILAVRAALRSGLGTVTAAYPECLATIFQKSVWEALNLILPETTDGTLAKSAETKIINTAKSADIVAIGPGLGKNPITFTLVIKLINKLSQPVIIDADGLNALAGSRQVEKILKKRQSLTVLTPHEGEMSRLTGLTVKYIASHRIAVASHYAKKWKTVVVLKGYRTVVSAQSGELYVNYTGGPALATPGSGDVLTGILAALIARHPDNFFSASAVAVYVHGLAGDMATTRLGENSVLAGDLLGHLPEAFKRAVA